ncbi:MAG: sugar phosphate nucleotidyltransferase, partial [Pseudomonadota bacterium]|nr:sugar phosphate nucleotidyltransferase [Pseudomonadota bacterium]
DMVLHTTGCLKQMVETYKKTGGNLVAVENVPADQTFRYGILDPETDDGQLVKIRGMVEKPAPEEAPSDLAIIGRYILDPMIMEILDKGKKGAGGEIQITDAMADLIGTCPLHGLRFEGTRYDCGNKAGFLAANLAYAALDPELVDGLQEQIRTIFK